MKNARMTIWGMTVCVVLTLVNITASYGYTSFDISQYPGIQWNALGLAVNPQNGHVFLSSNSYGGEDNLYEFNSNGDLIYSTRAAFYTGPSGNLGSMVVGKDGHLFLDASYYDFPTLKQYIIEIGQDGRAIFAYLPNMNAHAGISYSPQTDNLFYVEQLSPMNYQINEITPEGTLISQFGLEGPFVSTHYSGLVYDPLSEDFYVNELHHYANILDQYSKNEFGEYVYVMSYDMKSILSGVVLDIDINRSNGLFYAQEGNENVVIFSLDELDSFYIHEPPKTYYVDPTDGSDDNDGLTPETAFATIQKAINSSFDGDTVLVADGTYTGEGNRDIDFLAKAITVRSESGPENCIIDCNGTEAEPHRGFYFQKDEDTSSILDGFTIINGYAWQGGGIYCHSSNPTIIGCTITGNSVKYGGGGIYCDESSSPAISNCTIKGNSAGRGGGIYCVQSSPTVVNCTITGNVSGNGGGIYCALGNLIITNCTISSNSAGVGGGICCYRRSSSTITNSILWGNEALDGPEMCLIYKSNALVSYSNVQGGQADVSIGLGCTLNWCQGNIDADPCFVEPGYWADANDPNIIVEPNDPNAVWVDGDYHLLPDSPCIDAGDPNYIAEPNETDLDGNPRVSGDAIDMGAYETIIHKAQLLLLPRVINRKSSKPRIMAWVHLPQGITKDQIDANSALVLYPGGIKAMRQFVFQNRKRTVSIFAVFDKAELMDAIPAGGRVQLQVLGYLIEPGQYFCGSDTVRIIHGLSKSQVRHRRK